MLSAISTLVGAVSVAFGGILALTEQNAPMAILRELAWGRLSWRKRFALVLIGVAFGGSIIGICASLHAARTDAEARRLEQAVASAIASLSRGLFLVKGQYDIEVTGSGSQDVIIEGQPLRVSRGVLEVNIHSADLLLSKASIQVGGRDYPVGNQLPASFRIQIGEQDDAPVKVLNPYGVPMRLSITHYVDGSPEVERLKEALDEER